MTDSARHCAITAVENPHHAVHHVGDIDVFLIRIRRKADGPNRSAAAIVGYWEFFEELALLRKYLNSVATAVADIDEPIMRNTHAVDRFPELFGERSSRGTWRQGIVVDLTQGDSVG